MPVYRVRKITNPIGFIVLGILFVGIGVFFGIVIANKQADLIARCTESASGVVVSVSEERDSDNNIEYEYTVEFEVGGKKYEHEDKSSQIVSHGDKFTVKYDPDDPSSNYIEGKYASPKMVRTIGIVFGAAGVISLLWGIVKKIRGN